MIWSAIAAAARNCVRFTRRTMHGKAATMHGSPPKLTMQQAAAILAPRPRIVRRAVAIACPAAALPTVAVPPVPGAALAPLPAMPGALPAPLPFDIGTGPLLPPMDALPVLPVARLYDTIAQAPAGVPEPGALAVLLVALTALVVLAWRRV